MTDKVVYFLRHGEAQSNANHFYAGQTDAALTARGLEQAKQVAPMLQHIHFDKVFCSDLQRAKNTAAMALPHCECEYTKNIREIHVGSVAGLYLDECEKLYGDQYWYARNNTDYSAFGGESNAQLKARAKAFLDLLSTLEDTPVVGAVCHGGFIRATAACVLQDATGLAMPDNCAVAKFTYKNGVWKLNKWNVTVEI